jgi:hypothetical protein
MRTTTYAWQQAVQDAIGGSDANQLERKIQLAEMAIFERIDRFSAADDGEDVALFEALDKLRALNQLLILPLVPKQIVGGPFLRQTVESQSTLMNPQ